MHVNNMIILTRFDLCSTALFS